MRRRLRLPAVLTTAFGAVATAAVVWALWTTGGTGTASGTVGTLAAPTNVSGTPVSSTVTVTWTGSTAPDAGLVEGYYVQRRFGTTTVDACGSSPSTLLPAAPTACVETEVPNGTYTYDVTAVFRSWTATGTSPPVTVLDDTVPPTLTVAFPADGGLYGSARWNAGGGSCSSAVCGTASDAGAGVDNVEVSIRQGSGNYWNASTSSFSSPVELLRTATGTTSWSLPFPASNFATDASYTVRVVATDAATNATVESRTFSYENTAPVTTDDSASIGNAWKTTAQTVTLTPGDGSGSGVAATYYTTDGSTPTTGSSEGRSIALTSDGTYTVKYFSVDNAGNQESVKTAGTQIRIDKTAPTGGALTVNGVTATDAGSSSTSTSGTFSISWTDYAETASSSASGLTSSTLVRTSATLSGNTCDTFGSASTLTGATTQTLATGCYRYVLTGTDVAGNSVSVTTTVKVDTSAPSFGSPALTLGASGDYAYSSGTTAYYNGNAGTSSSFTVSAPNVADADTGLAKVNFPGPAGFSGGGDDLASPHQATYTWSASSAVGTQTVTATNGVANTATTAFTLVRDVTAPAGGALTVNTVAATSAGSSSWNKTGSFAIGTRTNYSEAQSGSAAGLKSSTLTRQQATFTNSTGACGIYGTATTITGNPDQSGLAEACYLYTLSGIDNVGNTVSISTTVKVDKTNPTVAVTGWAEASGSGNTKVNFAGTGEPGGSVTVTICAGSFPCSGSSTRGTVIATVQSDGTWQTGDSGNIGTGTFSAQATETDLAGNTGTSSTFGFTQS